MSIYLLLRIRENRFLYSKELVRICQEQNHRVLDY